MSCRNEISHKFPCSSGENHRNYLHSSSTCNIQLHKGKQGIFMKRKEACCVESIETGCDVPKIDTNDKKVSNCSKKSILWTLTESLSSGETDAVPIIVSFHADIVLNRTLVTLIFHSHVACLLAFIITFAFGVYYCSHEHRSIL